MERLSLHVPKLDRVQRDPEDRDGRINDVFLLLIFRDNLQTGDLLLGLITRRRCSYSLMQSNLKEFQIGDL
jgi:hypothetical protein